MEAAATSLKKTAGSFPPSGREEDLLGLSVGFSPGDGPSMQTTHGAFPVEARSRLFRIAVGFSVHSDQTGLPSNMQAQARGRGRAQAAIDRRSPGLVFPLDWGLQRIWVYRAHRFAGRASENVKRLGRIIIGEDEKSWGKLAKIDNAFRASVGHLLWGRTRRTDRPSRALGHGCGRT